MFGNDLAEFTLSEFGETSFVKDYYDDGDGTKISYVHNNDRFILDDYYADPRHTSIFAVDINFDGYRDSDNDRDTHNVIAKAMAATSEWTRSDVSNAVGWLQEKNNDSGFNGKPGGEKYIRGFQSINECAIWWTSTPNTGDNCWDRYLFFSRDFCNRTNNHRSIGMSVRCIQD